MRLEHLLSTVLVFASISHETTARNDPTTTVTGTGCSFPLGMELGIIADNQLSASSSWDSSWRPQEARLNNGNAWYPSSYSTSEWLQIDLRERMSITGIQTQGHQYFSTSYYVKSFKLLYSDYGTNLNWSTFQENGSDKIFVGNRNTNGVKTNDIDPPIVARFIRLMAVTWKNGIAFRLELLGCELEPTTTSIAPLTTETLPTTKVETTVFIPIATSTLKTTTVQQTTPSTAVTTHSLSSTKKTTVTTELITTAVPQRSTSSISSGPGMPSPSSVNSAIIGGAVAAGVVILIIAIVVSIFFIRRRRSKDTDEKESSPQPEETGTVDNIYYGGVRFAANGNASTNGNVSIGQSDGMVDNHLYAYAGTTNGNASMTGQSEGMVDNHLYAGTTNGNVPIDQSEGTVDNHLYAGTGDACLETRHHVGDEGAQENVYYNVAHMSDEG